MLRLPGEGLRCRQGEEKERGLDRCARCGRAVFGVQIEAPVVGEAKASLTDLKPLKTDIDSMAAAIVQVYKTIADIATMPIRISLLRTASKSFRPSLRLKIGGCSERSS